MYNQFRFAALYDNTLFSVMEHWGYELNQSKALQTDYTFTVYQKAAFLQVEKTGHCVL